MNKVFPVSEPLAKGHRLSRTGVVVTTVDKEPHGVPSSSVSTASNPQPAIPLLRAHARAFWPSARHASCFRSGGANLSDERPLVELSLLPVETGKSRAGRVRVGSIIDGDLITIFDGSAEALALTSMTPGMFNERPSDFLPGS